MRSKATAQNFSCFKTKTFPTTGKCLRLSPRVTRSQGLLHCAFVLRLRIETWETLGVYFMASVARGIEAVRSAAAQGPEHHGLPLPTLSQQAAADGSASQAGLREPSTGSETGAVPESFYNQTKCQKTVKGHTFT